MLTRRSPNRLLVTVSVLAVALASAPGTGLAAGTVSDLFTITNDAANPPTRFEAFDAITIATFDLDGDGVKEIITHNDNNHPYVFDGATGALIAELTTKHPERWGARELAGIGVGDVNGNGVPDLVITNSAGWLTVFEAQPNPDPERKLEFVKLWERWMDPHKEDPDYRHTMRYGEWEGYPGLDGPPYLADVDDDGRDEIFVQLDDMPGHYAVNGDGTVRWWDHVSDGNSNPTVTDLTGDGRLEVMFASDGGRVWIRDASSGDVHCKTDVKAHGPWPGSISVSPTVVDLTGDGRKEIVFGVRNVAEDRDDPGWIHRSHAHYFAITADCGKLWHRTFEWGNPHVHMSPIPVDVTGNGLLDVVIHDWNTVGHKPGNWENTGPANLFALDGRTGELLWRVDTNSYWSNKNVAAADVTGDGQVEFLVIDASQNGEDGISLYSLHGERKGFISAGAGWTVSRGPSVMDLNGDETLEILLPVHRASDHCTRNLDVGCREGALKVYTTGSTGSRAWSNVALYNHKYEEEGEAWTTDAPEVHVDAASATGEALAIDVEASDPVDVVQVRLPGAPDWHALDHVDGNRFASADLTAPGAGAEVQVRVTAQDGRMAYASLAWPDSGNDGDGGSDGNDESPEWGTVEGTVTDADGNPVAGAEVDVARGGEVLLTRVTDANGTFSVQLPEGSYALTVSAEHLDTTIMEVTVESGATATPVVTLEPASTAPPPSGEGDGSGFTTLVGIASALVAVALVGVIVARRGRRMPPR